MPEVTEQYVHYPVRDKGGFQEGSFRTITIDASKGIKAVIGRPGGGEGTKVQKFLFATAKGWTMDKARAWVKSHEHEEHSEKMGEIIVLWDNDESAFPTRALALAGMYEKAEATTDAELAEPEPVKDVHEFADDALDTETVEGVRIASVGKYTDRHGKEWNATGEVLDHIAASHGPLHEQGWRVPVVLSHDLDPRESTNPVARIALGWVTNVRRVGADLVADLMKVPRKIAALMRSGAWSSVSPRVLKDLKVGEHTAPWALGHLSLCGEKHPAMANIKSFDDIAGLYQAEGNGGVLVQYDASWSFDLPDGEDEGGKDVADNTEFLTAHGVKSEDELDALIEKGRKFDEVEKARDTSTTELERVKTETAEGEARHFVELNMTKIKPDHRKTVIGALVNLTATEYEFTEGDKTEKIDLAAGFKAWIESMDDVVELDEKGPGSAKDARDKKVEVEAKPETVTDGDAASSGLPKAGVEFSKKVAELAKEIEKDEGLSAYDALATATERLEAKADK